MFLHPYLPSFFASLFHMAQVPVKTRMCWRGSLVAYLHKLDQKRIRINHNRGQINSLGGPSFNVSPPEHLPWKDVCKSHLTAHKIRRSANQLGSQIILILRISFLVKISTKSTACRVCWLSCLAESEALSYFSV